MSSMFGFRSLVRVCCSDCTWPSAGVAELCLPYLGHKRPQVDGTPQTASQASGSGGAEEMWARLPALLAATLYKRSAVTTALELPCMHLWGSSDAHACVLLGGVRGASMLQSLDVLQVRPAGVNTTEHIHGHIIKGVAVMRLWKQFC